jgi:hypothetical protein
MLERLGLTFLPRPRLVFCLVALHLAKHRLGELRVVVWFVVVLLVVG